MDRLASCSNKCWDLMFGDHTEPFGYILSYENPGVGIEPNGAAAA